MLKGGQYGISVNGIPHQGIAPARHRAEIFYTPYRQAPANPLGNVLMIGAGGGNDVAIALQQGAKHVDAVEIDPQLYARKAAESGPSLSGSPGHRRTSTTAGPSSSRAERSTT